MHRNALIVLGFLAAASRVVAQPVPNRTPTAPTATFAEPFSRVGGVRELSDGRVIVLDSKEIRILRIDFRDGSATPLGRPGRGPGEYTLPFSLVGLGGDTTLAVDMSGGGRALLITKEGVNASTIQSAGIARGTPIFQTDDVQSDARGRLYELVMRRYVNAQPPNDSGGIRRLDRQSGKRDTIASISRMIKSPLLRPASAASGGEGAQPVAIGGAPPPFMSVDQWAVAPDGRIAVVSVEPYRVTFIADDGRQTVGAPIPYTPERVNDAQKARWRELKAQPVRTIYYGANGSMVGGTSKPRYAEPREWPDVLPPFLANAVQFAPDGQLWIERTTPAGAPQTFDVIDRVGRRASRVVLAPRTRLVGFGARTMYTVRIDDDDLEYLQRHARP